MPEFTELSSRSLGCGVEGFGESDGVSHGEETLGGSGSKVKIEDIIEYNF